MPDQSSRKRRLLIVLGAFLIALIVLGVNQNMKRSFAKGHFGGIYWFLIGYDQVVFPLICLALAALLIRPFLKRSARPEKDGRLEGAINSVIMLALVPVLLCFAGLPFVFNTFKHHDSISAQGHRYYLASRSQLIGGTNYLLVKCDSIGFLCRTVWSTGYSDYDHVKLALDSTTGQVSVQSGTRILYTYR
ncbi:MAG: hypothetical protein KatS3mg057_3224 [Herpetosiphonaceae bacterium]|nr:MAG: hypothetical protein KatS3mg057_3224 [Herpetosiphonaceae bacterium]